MRQLFLEVLNCSREKLDGETMPASGQHLGIGAWSGGMHLRLKPTSNQL